MQWEIISELCVELTGVYFKFTYELMVTKTVVVGEVWMAPRYGGNDESIWKVF